jgi:hypothetical protein
MLSGDFHLCRWCGDDGLQREIELVHAPEQLVRRRQENLTENTSRIYVIS